MRIGVIYMRHYGMMAVTDFAPLFHSILKSQHSGTLKIHVMGVECRAKNVINMLKLFMDVLKKNTKKEIP
jgi:hypothetical protein